MQKKVERQINSLMFKVAFTLILMMTSLNAQFKFTNKLINEDSPYLQQHAHNPVNWHAWGEEAFEKAKKENKLIFLSIGYSTCHWCHVMEEESFENEKVAYVLNRDFISIKVDREEMPHIDKYYQDVYNLLNKRGGGWPLNMILTPGRKAFYAATYIPDVSKYGRMGIIELLNKVSDMYAFNPIKILSSADQIEDALEEYKTAYKGEKREIGLDLVSQFVTEVEESFDKVNFGIGIKPKFPHASTIETLLDIYEVTKNNTALDMATKMLKAMAKGGIYDQIEGGFYRYSVDEKWMIPHFEKMLYTNAELLSAYAKAYRITKDVFFKNIVDDMVSFIRVKFEYNSLLYSASDADSLIDSKKEEGAYFVFEYEQTKSFLIENGYNDNEVNTILKYFNITKKGNFEHKQNNVYLTNNKKPNNLKKVKKVLKKLRETKEYPFVDYKILTSWNAMYITSLFEAGKMNDAYSRLALKYMDTLLEKLYIKNTLYHQRLVNKKPKVEALFEDYSFLISSLLKAYDYSLDKKYLSLATKLSFEAKDKFYKQNSWYMSNDAFQNISSIYDSSYKSAQANMVDNILKVSILNDDLDFQAVAKQTLESNSLVLASRPSSTAWLLRSLMAFEKGYINLKATKAMLKNKILPEFPFLLRKVTEDKMYLACKVDVCFAYSKNFNDIVDDIYDVMKDNKK